MKYNVRCHHCGQLFPVDGQPGQHSEATCPHCGAKLQFTAPETAGQPSADDTPESNKKLIILVAVLALLTVAVYVGHTFYDSYLDRQHRHQMARLLQLDSARTVEAEAAEHAYAIQKSCEDSILRHSEQFIKEHVEEIYAIAFAEINGAPNDTIDISRDFFTPSFSEAITAARNRARRDSLAVAPPNFWTQGYSQGLMLPARAVSVSHITADSAQVFLKAEQRRSRPDEPLRTASYLGTLRLAFTNGRWLIDDFINERRGSFRRLLKPRPTPVEAETEAEPQDTE